MFRYKKIVRAIEMLEDKIDEVLPYTDYPLGETQVTWVDKKRLTIVCNNCKQELYGDE